MTVFIAADSEYVQYLPAAYQVVGEFKKFGPIELSCIGLERRQLEKIAVKNNTSLTILKDAYN